EIVNAYDKKVDFIWELEAMLGVDAAVKIIKFLNENLWKDEKRLRKLRNMEIDTTMKAGHSVSLRTFDVEISEELRLAREVNALCDCLTVVVDEREAFTDELDMLAGKYVLGKLAEFTK
nr:hypothetical protein [Tanacetum cinerariifolium]